MLPVSRLHSTGDRKINECGAIGRMRIGRGNRSTLRIPGLLPLRTPQIPHDLTWDRIQDRHHSRINAITNLDFTSILLRLHLIYKSVSEFSFFAWLNAPSRSKIGLHKLIWTNIYLKSTVFWVVMSYSLVGIYRRFGECCTWRLVYFPTLKMEAVRSSETSGNFYQTTHFPKGSTLHNHRRENKVHYIPCAKTNVISVFSACMYRTNIFILQWRRNTTWARRLYTKLVEKSHRQMFILTGFWVVTSQAEEFTSSFANLNKSPYSRLLL
jgi:hypothetical protein